MPPHFTRPTLGGLSAEMTCFGRSRFLRTPFRLPGAGALAAGPGPVPKSPESLPDPLATFWRRFNKAKETRGVSMSDKEPKPLTREQVVTLLGKHAKELATLARENGCETLYFLFQTAAEQAEKELGRSPSDGESSVS
jgi:hypothetical protein